MEQQACEVLIGAGIAVAILGGWLILHLLKAGREARRSDQDLARYLRGKDEEEQR